MTTLSQDPAIRRGALRWLRKETLGNLFLIALLFGLVGRWDWWNGWAMSAIYVVWSVATGILILPRHPEMLAERVRPHPGTKTWDKALLALMGALMLVQYVVACLDVRWGWTGSLPLGVQLAGLAVAALGYDALLVWAMASNAFFVATVRIQEDRGQRVVTGGPYRLVRHPGYTGTILFHLAAPLLLGSLWAIIPGVLASAVLVYRTAREDATLQAELPGYAEYAARVRHRLVPGVW